MTELSEIFERLGLVQYLERFIEEGFDSWETVLYVTESDLEVLEVKLGHRRKLQKEIAYARGITIEQVIGAIGRNPSIDDISHGDGDPKSSTTQGDSRNSSTGPSKRKYRRHPKPDENAPERAPSAYVIFSNKTREELKPHKLTFTEIAKIVGERWQIMSPEEKEPYERQAAMAKEKYNASLTRYKRTPQYREYQTYLTNFKAQNTAQPSSATKRPKLETEISGASSGSTASVNAIFTEAGPGKADSVSSQPVYSPQIGSTSPSVLGQITKRSQESIHQSSSLPNTPTNAEFSATHPIPFISSQKSFDVHPPQLPRILPLETRDTRPHIGSILADSASMINPRRSGNASPAAFLRQDTSKSSASSVISRESGVSSVYTPITPTDDTMSIRSLPPIPGLSTQGSADSAFSSDSDRRTPQLPHPPLPRLIAEKGIAVPKGSSGYPQSFRHLSIQSESQDVQRMPSYPSQDGNTQVRSSSTTDPIDRQSQFGVPEQPMTNRLDSLSVLALAGRLVDQESPDTGNSMDLESS